MFFDAVPFVGGLVRGLIDSSLHSWECVRQKRDHEPHLIRQYHREDNPKTGNAAVREFELARELLRDAQEDFYCGDDRYGLKDLSKAKQHMADGFSHLLTGSKAAKGSEKEQETLSQTRRAW
jgi:hypothetical protein